MKEPKMIVPETIVFHVYKFLAALSARKFVPKSPTSKLISDI
jgi:hypothetical protein